MLFNIVYTTLGEFLMTNCIIVSGASDCFLINNGPCGGRNRTTAAEIFRYEVTSLLQRERKRERERENVCMCVMREKCNPCRHF